MRSAKEIAAAREERELLKELAELPPSEFAKRVVNERDPEIATKRMLRDIAKDMGISVSELASEIIAAKAIQATATETIQSAMNSAYKIIAIDSKGVANWEWKYAPAPETISSRQFECGFIEIESRARQELVRAIIATEKATRQDYKLAAEILESIGREKGAVISSLPNGNVRVNSVRYAIDKEYADEKAEKVFAEYTTARAHLEEIETRIAAVPLSKGGKIESRIPAPLKRERAKALDAMKAILARVEKANARIIAANSPSADKLRMEMLAEFDAYSPIPNDARDAFAKLPNAIIRRPFKETIRPKLDRRDSSPVEAGILRNEWEREQEIRRAFVKAEFEKAIAEKVEFAEIEKANAKSARNAEYKMREAERSRRNREKARAAKSAKK